MKQGRKPTRKQKIALANVGLNPANWPVLSTCEGMLHIKHRYTGTKRIIPAE